MKERIYSLDAIKILATICIICHHYQIYTNTNFSTGVNFNDGLFEFGYLVELFFVLSGYFISTYIETVNEKMSFFDFFFHKYVRFITPCFLSVLAFAYLDLAYEQLYQAQFFDRTPTLWNVIQAGFLLTTGWGLEISKMNGAIWYISVLLICYIIFWGCTWISKRLDVNPYYSYALMIFVAFFVFSHNIDILFFNWHTSRGLSSFFWGIIMAKWIKNRDISRLEGGIAFTVLLIMTVFVIVFRHTFADEYINYVYTFLLYSPLIVFLQSKDIKRVFYSHIWGEISKISFEAYIWQLPVLLLILDADKAFNLNINYASRVIQFLLPVLCFAVGIVCYYLIELPAKKAISKFFFGG